MTFASTILDAGRRLVCPHEWRTERRLDYHPSGRVVVVARRECQRCGRTTQGRTRYPERRETDDAPDA